LVPALLAIFVRFERGIGAPLARNGSRACPPTLCGSCKLRMHITYYRYFYDTWHSSHTTCYLLYCCYLPSFEPSIQLTTNITINVNHGNPKFETNGDDDPGPNYHSRLCSKLHRPRRIPTQSPLRNRNMLHGRQRPSNAPLHPHSKTPTRMGFPRRNLEQDYQLFVRGCYCWDAYFGTVGGSDREKAGSLLG